MTQRRHTFSDSLLLNNWESFASTKHAQKQRQRQLRRKRAQDKNWNENKFGHGSPRPRAPSVFEEFSWCLFDQHDNIFNNDNILDLDNFTDTETQANTTPMSSAMNYSTPATTLNPIDEVFDIEIKTEPVLSDFVSDFDSDFEPCSPCLEEATVECGTATLAPTQPRETAKCVPLMPLIQQPTQPRKRKAATRQSKFRQRPYKNTREKRRRASIASKFTELHAVCISDAVTSIVPRPRAKELIVPSEADKPRKMDILRDSIRILEAMGKELIKLMARNEELEMCNSK